MPIQWSIHPEIRFVDGAPFSSLFEDVYKSRHGAFDEARQVFIEGCALSERWRSSFHHTILEVGFGLGVNFLATWQHWQSDPNRCARLFYLAIEKHPLQAVDLSLALGSVGASERHQTELIAQWPVLMAGLHRLSFDDGRVNLYLCIGDAQGWLNNLNAIVDSVYLDGFSPSHNPMLWSPPFLSAVARLCRQGACLASYSSAPEVRQALQHSGFEITLKRGFGGKHHRLEGRFSRQPLRTHLADKGLADVRVPSNQPTTRSVIVVGAGLAGSAVAQALCRRGWQVTVFRDPAQSLLGSTQPACVEHLHVSPDENLLARLTRSAWQLSRSGGWLATNRDLGNDRNLDTNRDLQSTHLNRLRGKLMLLHTSMEYDRWAKALAERQLAPQYLQLLDRDQTLTVAGWPPMHASPSLRGALWFPDARAADPVHLCNAWLSTDHRSSRSGNINVRACRIEHVRAINDSWAVLDDRRVQLAQASVLILCSAADAPRLLPLQSISTENRAGQSTLLHAQTSVPRTALGGAAYLCPIDEQSFLIGASFESPAGFVASAAGDTANLKRLSDSLGVSEAEFNWQLKPALLSRHVGVRCTTRDHLPVIGRWPDESQASKDSENLLKNSKLPVPILPGVYANFGYGARGLLWSVLAAEVISAQVHDEPIPLARDLAAVINPSRSIRRWLRKS